MVSTHVDTKNKRVSRSIVLAAIAVMSACIRPTASAAVLHTKENSNIVQDQTTQVMPLNESSTGLRAQRARRDVLPGVTLATIKANTGEVGAVFAKDTVIHPLSAVDASGHICPNAASRHCGRSSLPTDEAGIVIKSTGWYYVYGSVEFGTITQPTLLGWKIVVCHSLKHSGKSQCALNNGIRSTFEARRQALPTGNPLKGEPGTLFGGKVMYCYANDVISIMPLFNNLKINMYQETTYLGVYKLA